MQDVIDDHFPKRSIRIQFFIIENDNDIKIFNNDNNYKEAVRLS